MKHASTEGQTSDRFQNYKNDVPGIQLFICRSWTCTTKIFRQQYKVKIFYFNRYTIPKSKEKIKKLSYNAEAGLYDTRAYDENLVKTAPKYVKYATLLLDYWKIKQSRLPQRKSWSWNIFGT